jgi:hypothetical protein
MAELFLGSPLTWSDDSAILLCAAPYCSLARVGANVSCLAVVTENVITKSLPINGLPFLFVVIPAFRQFLPNRYPAMVIFVTILTKLLEEQ